MTIEQFKAKLLDHAYMQASVISKRRLNLYPFDWQTEWQKTATLTVTLRNLSHTATHTRVSKQFGDEDEVFERLLQQCIAVLYDTYIYMDLLLEEDA